MQKLVETCVSTIEDETISNQRAPEKHCVHADFLWVSY